MFEVQVAVKRTFHFIIVLGVSRARGRLTTMLLHICIMLLQTRIGPLQLEDSPT